MSTFEFVFSLFGLLLGLTLAEVLSGFARSVRNHQRVRVGYQAPLLGLIVMLDLTAFWLLVWGVREQLSVDYRTLVAGLLISGLYYLAAAMIFPTEEQNVADLDAHYARTKMKVFGALLICNLAAYVSVAAIGASPFSVPTVVRMSVFAALVLAIIMLRSKAWNIVLLGVASAMYLMATL